MAYDEALADRIRAVLADQPDISERPMFGGLSFMIDTKMAVAASGQGGLLVRIDPMTMNSVISSTAAEAVEMGGRTMRGWVHVRSGDIRTSSDLVAWVRRGVGYARTLIPA